VFALAIDARSPQTVYAGTNFGTLLSSDAGTSWTSENSGVNGTVVNALAISGGAMYAATGGSGVLRSDDGGASWKPVETDALTVFSVVSDGTAVYAGTDQGLWRSTAGGDWSPVATALATASVYSIAVDASDPSVLYAGICMGGLYRSADGGNTWSVEALGAANLTVFAVAIDPAHPASVYAGTDHGLFESFDGGATWNAAPEMSGSVFSLAIDPPSGTVYAGTDASGVFLSRNGGATWMPSSTGLPAASVYTLAVDRGKPGVLYAGTRDSGIFRSPDGGNSWTADNAGLTSTTVFSLAFGSSSASRVYAGTYGGGVFGNLASGPAAQPVGRRAVVPIAPPAAVPVGGSR
jgi:photosystem II stability/assembly factor-like uncharacterized protein